MGSDWLFLFLTYKHLDINIVMMMKMIISRRTTIMLLIMTVNFNSLQTQCMENIKNDTEKKSITEESLYKSKSYSSLCHLLTVHKI